MPNVGPYIYIYIYIYTTLAFLALLGAPYIYIYDISSLRVNTTSIFLSFLFNGSPGVKRPGREADHLVPPVSETRMSGAVPLLLLYAFGAWTRKTLLLRYF